MSQVHYQFQDNVASIVLRIPPQNRFSDQMSGEFGDTLDALERDGECAVLVRAGAQTLAVVDPERHARHVRRPPCVVQPVREFAIPTVVAVQGICLGGHFELALRADIVFASEKASFGHPEQSIGLVTLLRLAARAGHARAMELAMTSERVPAVVMHQAGLVNHVVALAELRRASSEFVRRAAPDPRSLTPRTKPYCARGRSAALQRQRAARLRHATVWQR